MAWQRWMLGVAAVGLAAACGGGGAAPDRASSASSSSTPMLAFGIREGALGAACDTSADCETGFCDRTVPGGMCTAECEDDSACGSGRCWQGFCFARCSAPIECRSGEFDCYELEGGGGICGFDTSAAIVMAPNVGATCRADIECMAPGGLEAFCIPEVDELGRETGYGGGMCVGLGCISDADCGAEGVCFDAGALPYCVPRCDEATPCRDGLACVDGMCGPG